ncbi:mitochondrial ribosomal protein S17 [Megalopta genalis]|uniref:mitochondrial ribosomal protein S17 n=1 Tax=Megalopta genalis TaxID=115081 RepID=UPI003FD2E2DA
MAKNKAAKEVLTYLLGVCVPTAKENAAKIRIRKLEFDNHLLMYFGKHEFVYAIDPNKISKIGDTVLIQNLPERLTRLITHKIVDVVYPLGDMTDPITGKKVVAGKYRDDIEQDTELFGKLDSTFEYDKAPQRGSMEGKRDFSNKKTYVKYNDDPNNDDPCAVNPF